MNMITAKPLSEPFRIGIVTSTFNEHITRRLYEGAVKRLKELQVNPECITATWVPGAVEIPIVAKAMAETCEYDVIVAFGCVIRGDTDHYVYVCELVSNGCQRVSLDYGLPVIFGVLTTNTEQQAVERVDGPKCNMGSDCIDTAVATLSVVRQIAPQMNEDGFCCEATPTHTHY
ncbi:MAG: 6,7-dimethyl-8-ribityllumazine synthase [Verrucomicrobia bacterium]|nr:6,7-dimethyl-8-ribityllumazine synthase [Verrucomicrobiota bacterium]MBS0635986.1 6,7-dimethyl-8-ribityllumazine synthase [Verrucomicrobiota bacterium]